MPPELDVPDLPECAWHVWTVYHRLSRTRQNGMSANPISYTEIQAYCQLHHDHLAGWELNVITGIDATFLHSIYEEQEKPKKKKL